jgi:iron complex transport system substrate-binding protein
MKNRCAARLRSLGPIMAIVGVALVVTGASSATSPPPKFPLKLKAADGVVTIMKRPARIVSLSATATEDLYAVGGGKQVVAVDSYSTYPPQAPRTHLSGFTPNIEAIAKHRPDLVLLDADANHIVREFGKVGIPVLVEPPAANLNDVYAEITQIAKVAGHAQTASRVNANIRRQVGDRALGAAADDAVDGLPRARPALLLGDVAHLHRSDVQAARPGEHRRQGERLGNVSAALGRVHHR